MKNYKKKNLYFILLMLFSYMNAVDSKQSAELDAQYSQESTEYVSYDVCLDEQEASENEQSLESQVVSDQKFTNICSLGLEPKKIMTEVKEGQHIITSQAKTGINSEPFTWMEIGQIAAKTAVVLVICGCITSQLDRYTPSKISKKLS